MAFDDEDVRNLAEKLKAMNLAAGERAALDALVDAAAGDAAAEVEGFARQPLELRIFGALGVASTAGTNPEGIVTRPSSAPSDFSSQASGSPNV